MEIVTDSAVCRPTIVESSLDRSSIKPQVLRSIQSTIEKVTDGKRIYVFGVHVSAEEVVRPDFLLPATLFSACEALSSSSNSNAGNIDFSFDLKPDDASVLRFRVSYITVSPLRRLTTAVKSFMRQTKRGDEFILDEHLTRFTDFLQGVLPPEEHLFESDIFPFQLESDKTFTFGIGSSP